MQISEQKPLSNFFMLLPLIALGLDLFTPFLIWKNVLPAEIRWLSHITITIMILLTVIKMFLNNYFPRAFWLILAVSVVWSYIAMGHGQGISSTLWGIWLLFQFPFIALFAYLHGSLSEHLMTNILKYGLTLVGVELAVQLLQYAFGEPPGDNLAGLFAKNGTAIAFIFALLVNCIFLGYWIVSKKWIGLIAVLSFSLVSSVLAELKVFPFVITVAGLMAAFLYAIKYHSLVSFIKILSLTIGISIGFAFLYDNVIPAATRVPFQAYLQDPTRLSNYLYFSQTGYNSQGYHYSAMGRMEAIQIGVDALKEDPITFLFGYGLGSRSESRTLGTTGVGLSSGNFGFSSGTSLLVMMQETGIVGLAILSCLILWIISTLAHDIHAMPDSPENSLRYGLILFSVLWPILLWYANVWTMRVPMLSYWYLLGYILAKSRELKTPMLETKPNMSLQRT